MSATSWKDFEKLTMKIQRELSPDAEVKINQTFLGVSGTKNQCDVIIDSNNNGLKFKGIIECKDYNKKIGISYLREFKSKIDDINANSGTFITTIGYTKEAIKYAAYHGIETYTLFDAESINWSKHAFLPILINFILIKKYRIIFYYQETNRIYHRFYRNEKINVDKIFTSHGVNISIDDILSSIWAKIDFKGNESIKLKTHNGELFCSKTHNEIYCTIDLNAKLEKKYIKIPLIEGKGFKSDKCFLSLKYMTDDLNLNPNYLYQNSKPLKKNMHSEFELKIVERLAPDINYILPKSIAFTKNDFKRSIIKK